MSYPPPSGVPVRFAAPEESMGAVASVIGAPTRATIPLHKLAPEAALRRLELTIVRRLEGFLHGDHLGLLPGPGSDLSDARTGQAVGAGSAVARCSRRIGPPSSG